MNLKYALHYAKQGYHVLPTHYLDPDCSCGKDCRSPGKHPVSNYVRNGVLDATTDLGIIKEWWRDQNWNIAIRTGVESGVFVVDVDREKDMDALNEIPDTLTAVTPRGIHFYFQWEEGITNRSKIFGLEIDVRGMNGYVLAPPSRNYVWYNSLGIAKAPSWLIRSIRKG